MAFAACYLALKCCAMPGCSLATMVVGAVVGVERGFPIVSILAAGGSLGCYWLSRLCARGAVNEYLLDRMSVIRALLRRASMQRTGRLPIVRALLYLRVFPFTPGWVLDMVDPHIGVSPSVHVTAAFFGSMPHTISCLYVGGDLAQFFLVDSELSSPNNVM